MMSVLPEHPDLDQTRRRAISCSVPPGQATLVRSPVWRRCRPPLTLAGAQLAMAREFGQPSWMALVREIEARNASIPESVMRFLRSSVICRSARRPECRTRIRHSPTSGFPPRRSDAAYLLGEPERPRRRPA